MGGYPGLMASSKLLRGLVIGAFAAVAAAVPVYAELSAPAATPQAGPQCLAWLGSRVDGQCIGQAYDNGSGSFNIGTPSVGFAPNNNGGGSSLGISTAPLFPGYTI